MVSAVDPGFGCFYPTSGGVAMVLPAHVEAVDSHGNKRAFFCPQDKAAAPQLMLFPGSAI
jgi:hypothetical protein